MLLMYSKNNEIASNTREFPGMFINLTVFYKNAWRIFWDIFEIIFGNYENEKNSGVRCNDVRSL